MENNDTEVVLRALADDAFNVMNWARRSGFNKEKQIEEVAKAFKVTLTEKRVEIVTAQEAHDRAEEGFPDMEKVISDG